MEYHFTLKELCYSATAEKLGIINIPMGEEFMFLSKLVLFILEPARIKIQKPIRITSGYRCPALNKAVGGIPISQHVKGQAVDFTCGTKEENRKLWIDMQKDDLFSYDQLILENDGAWIHASYRDVENNRKQAFEISLKRS